MTDNELHKILKSCDHTPLKKGYPGEDWTPLVSYQQSQHPINYYYKEWCDYFHKCLYLKSEDHLSLMGKKELELYNSLPDEKIKVYRGIAVKSLNDVQDNFGFSWTLDKNIAEWFSKVFSRRSNDKLIPIVLEREIEKNMIVWVLLDRDEKEVVVYDYEELREGVGVNLHR